jgi:hypothetical protein
MLISTVVNFVNKGLGFVQASRRNSNQCTIHAQEYCPSVFSGNICATHDPETNYHPVTLLIIGLIRAMFGAAQAVR